MQCVVMKYIVMLYYCKLISLYCICTAVSQNKVCVIKKTKKKKTNKPKNFYMSGPVVPCSFGLVVGLKFSLSLSHQGYSLSNFWVFLAQHFLWVTSILSVDYWL